MNDSIKTCKFEFMNLGTLHTDIQNKIATVTFYHPSGNSFPGYLLDELATELINLSTNNLVHVIVLKSEGNRAFCAGASFDELLAVSNAEEGALFFMGFAKVLNAMRHCSKIIIGAVQGKTVGGGVGLAAACDYCFAVEVASIKLSELSIGIGPFVIAPAVERKIGKAAFCELSLDALSWQTAFWAKEKGLFSKVYQTREEMNIGVAKFSEKLASYNPDALSEMKKVFWSGTDSWDELLEERAKISGKLVLSDFTKEALSKFKK